MTCRPTAEISISLSSSFWSKLGVRKIPLRLVCYKRIIIKYLRTCIQLKRFPSKRAKKQTNEYNIHGKRKKLIGLDNIYLISQAIYKSDVHYRNGLLLL